MNTNNPFGEIIYAYTRQQAIADGVLVDLSDHPMTRKHWKIGLCCSSAVWTMIEEAVQQGKDLAGVLHDLYTLAKWAIKPNGDATDRICFRANIGKHEDVDLILHCGPGDTPLPCLTLMLPSDD